MGSSSPRGVPWRPTKMMNMRDLSKDDDFLSHLLVEKLGTGAVPLLVHKMDSSRRLPKTDAEQLLQIVRRLVTGKQSVSHSTKQAVDELLALPPIRFYIKSYTQKQINAFATHASRYFELYHPSGSIEISHTSRYSHRTGKSELCILATRAMAPGTVITELKGSMAHLTEEEDRELKRTDLRNSDIRRDFSVIHSKQMKRNHLFLGPARFVNHDCDNNCELFREGKYITFRVLKPIAIGDEITAHYGDGYFGRKNRHCLCETCEKRGRGGYAPVDSDEHVESSSESDGSSSDSGSNSSDTSDDTEDETKGKEPLNLNERRTRRGVYAVTREEEEEEDESEEENSSPLADRTGVQGDGVVKLECVMDTTGLRIPEPMPPSSSAPKRSHTTGRDFSPVSSVSTDSLLEWDPDDPDAAEFDPSLTTEQHDRLRRKRKHRLWQITKRGICKQKKSKLASAVYRYKAELVRLRLNTPPPTPPRAPSPPTRRVTRSISAMTPLKMPVTRNRQDEEMSSQSQSVKHKGMDIVTQSTPTRRPTRRSSERNHTEPTQLVTPPLSEETTSLPDSSASTPRRAKRSAIPSSTKDCHKESEPGVLTRSKGKEKDKEQLIEEPESKVLRRGRPSLPANPPNASKESPPTPKRDIPRGRDGKPLPTCVTCLNILPVISVDSLIVWGLGVEISPRRSKKSKEKQECPRCMRHFAIYGQAWPSRISGHGPTFLPTPREESTPVESPTRRVTEKALPALDRKLAAAASASRSRRRERSEENSPTERPSKKRKTEPSSHVEISDNARKALLGKGRPRNERFSAPGAQTHQDDAQERKRGRPRVTTGRQTGRQVSPVDDQNSMKLKSLAVQSQPRESNGRFGKKGHTSGTFMRKKFTTRPFDGGLSRAERAIERGKVKSWLERKEEGTGGDNGGPAHPTKKRARESDSEQQGSTAKKTQIEHDNDTESSNMITSTHTIAFSGIRFKGLGLSSTPNPMSFARRTWAPAISGLDGDRSIRTALTSPETDLNLEDPPVSSTRDVDMSKLSFSTSRHISAGALTFKPSPFNFARRRWSSLGDSSVDDDSAPQGDMNTDTNIDNEDVGVPVISCLSEEPGMVSRDDEVAVFPKLPDPTNFVLRPRSFDFVSYSIDDSDSAEELIDPGASSDDDSEDNTSPIHDGISGIPRRISGFSISALAMNLRRSPSFSTDDAASPPNLIHAGWDDSSSDASADS